VRYAGSLITLFTDLVDNQLDATITAY